MNPSSTPTHEENDHETTGQDPEQTPAREEGQAQVHEVVVEMHLLSRSDAAARARAEAPTFYAFAQALRALFGPSTKVRHVRFEDGSVYGEPVADAVPAALGDGNPAPKPERKAR